jgi:uncharacterized protein (TIGR03086 family)
VVEDVAELGLQCAAVDLLGARQRVLLGDREQKLNAHGRALDGDPAGELDKALRQVADAYAGLPSDAGQVPTPLGPLPLPLAAGAAAMDAAVHAWDIAVATGQDRPLSAELAEGIRPAADHLVDRLRDAYRVFAPALTVAPDYDRAEALLAFLGRDPHWTPASS